MDPNKPLFFSPQEPTPEKPIEGEASLRMLLSEYIDALTFNKNAPLDIQKIKELTEKLLKTLREIPFTNTVGHIEQLLKASGFATASLEELRELMKAYLEYPEAHKAMLTELRLLYDTLKISFQ